MKQIYKKLLILAMTLSMLMGMTACGTKNDAGTNATNTPQTTATPQATEAAVTYPLIVKSSDGTEVTIKEEPKKIVSVAPNLTELVYKLDASDKLVGRTDYCDYPSEVSKVASIGSLTTPDIEKIISLQPEVVLVSTHFNADNTRKLTDAGIVVLSLYEEHEVTGVYTMIDTLGKVLNRTEQAAETVTAMKTEIADVEKALEGVNKTSVYYVVAFGESGDFTAGGDTFIGNMLTMAGGDNIAADVEGWNYSLEKLVEKDPEYIIIGKGLKDAFTGTKQYKVLTAVKEGKVIEIDTNLLDRQGYRNAEGIKELAKALHPDKVK